MLFTTGSLLVGVGGFCVLMWRRYLSAPVEADQVSVGVEPVVLLSNGPVRLNAPGGLQAAAAVLNVAQPLVVNGHVLAVVFFATTRHS